jgi:transcriptional regulator with XRE-family HTH domain
MAILAVNRHILAITVNRYLYLMEKTIHQGQNIKRFRDMLGMKQDTFAAELGSDWTQKKVSLLEAKEIIDQDILEHVAQVLKVPVDAIKYFSEEAAINNIACNFNDHSAVNYRPVFNPIDKWVETLDENKKLYAALLKEKDEKIALLERLLADKK